MSDKKYFNLTIIDRQPQVENFVYRGVSKQDKLFIEAAFQDNSRVLKFSYDDGSALIATETVHTLIFSAYMTEEQEEEQSRPQRDD